MKIELKTPCNQPGSSMTPIAGGSFCSVCAKTVTDYSSMTDAEMLKHISKHGLGCGKFTEQQLDRELMVKQKRKRVKFFYLPLIAGLLTKPVHSIAQSVPDTIQSPNTIGCKQPITDLDNRPIVNFDADTNKVYRFGTGNVKIVGRMATRIPFTPIHVMHLRYWSMPKRMRLYPIISFSKRWYVPFMAKR